MKPNRPTPAQIRALKRRDPVLGAALERAAPFPGFPNPGQPYRTHYQALARAIVSQQLSTKAAATIHGRVCALTPGRFFPGTAELLSLSDEALRGAGLSRGKLLALRDLATRIEDGSLPLRSIGRRADEDVIEELVQVRGIGVWSAQMFLIFKLGRLDVMATGDLGLREGLRRLDRLDERPGPDALLERSVAWAPLRSVASWVLWRVLESREDT